MDRNFNGRDPLEAIVSDLTYVRVGNRWNYICTIMDLFNREIIGYSVGPNKDAKLVYQDKFKTLEGSQRELVGGTTTRDYTHH